MKKFIGQFVGQWQELVVWIPVLVAASWGLYKYVPQLDPRTGVDGLGFLCGLVEAAILVSLIFFFTRLYRRTYGASDDAGYQANTDTIRTNYPIIFYVTENLHRLVVLLAVIYCFKR